MNLAAAICFFQDKDSLKRCLDSLKDFEHVICVDGKFSWFDAPNELSDDGSKEIVESYPNTLYVAAPNLLEPNKRNLYFILADNIENLLLIDSDEWVEGDVIKWKQNLPKEDGFYCVWYDQQGAGGGSPRPSLIHNPSRYRYFRVHNVFKDLYTDSIFRHQSSYQLTKGITIKGSDNMRTKEHTEESIKYQTKLIAYEEPIRETLHLN